MTRESAILAQELAIVLWLTVVANVAVWWALRALLFESAHQERYGRFRARWRLMLDMARHPLSAPSMLARDVVERFRAPLEAADDPAVERRRTGSWAAYGVYVVVIFVGLPVCFVLVAVIRKVLPGTVTVWILVADALLLTAWVREGARAIRSLSQRPFTAVACVAGSLMCLISAGVSIALWQAGGIVL